MPTLLGEQAAGRKQPEHPYLYWENGEGRYAVLEKNWKLVVGGAGGGKNAKNAQEGKRKEAVVELFDLVERSDRIDEHRRKAARSRRTPSKPSRSRPHAEHVRHFHRSVEELPRDARRFVRTVIYVAQGDLRISFAMTGAHAQFIALLLAGVCIAGCNSEKEAPLKSFGSAPAIAPGDRKSAARAVVEEAIRAHGGKLLDEKSAGRVKVLTKGHISPTRATRF